MVNIDDSIEMIRSAFGILDFNRFVSTDSSGGSVGHFSQEDVITSILSGRDTLAIIPTGGGKSVCFQGPAICFEGLTIVITPLVALIKDQVNNFNSTTDAAYADGRIPRRYRAIYPGMDNMSAAGLLEEMDQGDGGIGPFWRAREMDPGDGGIGPNGGDEDGNAVPDRGDANIEYKLLYLSPERLSIPKFARLIREKEYDGTLRIDQIVVDEVHCLSQWGFDFRESYLNIMNFIDARPKRPVISAFTATATPQDVEYIRALLGFDRQMKKGRFSYYENIETRQNLILHQMICNDGADRVGAPSRYETLLDIMDRHHVADIKLSPATIIYCTTIKQTEYLYGRLLQDGRIPAERLCLYHARMSESARLANSQRFIRYDHNVMIATKAFGMGIDKENIGLIIHFDIPLCLEEYYQEIGRAGRGQDNIMAYCYLLYSYGSPLSKEEGPPAGSYLFTQMWVNNDSKALMSLENKPIESMLTDIEKKAIIYLAKYRFLAVRNYCLHDFPDSVKRQHFITDYLRQQIYDSSFRQIRKGTDLSIGDDFLLSLKDDDDRYVFNMLIKDLKRRIKDVNDLNINNTKIANILRWHPDSYELNVPADGIEITEWKRANRKKNFRTVLPPDIVHDSAFIRSDRAGDPEILGELNSAWKMQPRRYIRASRYLFVVDSKSSACTQVFLYSDRSSSWVPCPEDDPVIDRMIGQTAVITGLFNKSRYATWRNMTVEDYLERSNNDEGMSDIDWGNMLPFAYIRGQRSRTVSFTIHGDEKPDYFDMCVADAVYSIGSNGFGTITVNRIWEVLTGDPNIRFSRSDSVTKRTIEGSLNRLMNLEISISDSLCEIPRSQFLPLRKKPAGELGFYYLDTPPLYRYAEEINGEIVRVPISLLGVHLGKRNRFKPQDPVIERHGFGYRWNACIENCVLCHYLLHRISISRGKRRGNYISFSSLRDILSKHLGESMRRDSSFLYLKIIMILLSYREIGVVDFTGYDDEGTYEIAKDPGLEETELISRLYGVRV